MRKIWFIAFFVCLNQLMQAQDPVFSQYYLFPTHLNPAFVGSTKGPNFNLIYRNQWPSIDQAYVTYAASYDQFFEKKNSGLGLVLVADDAGNGLLQTYKGSLQYAYRIRINRTSYIKGGIEAGILSQNLNWDQLIFFDQLDPQFGSSTPGGSTLPTAEVQPDNLSSTVFDIGVGLMYYNPYFYAGLSIKHINTPNLSFYENDDEVNDRFPMHLNLHVGGNINFGTKYNPSDLYFSPSLIFVNQGDFNQITVGAHLYSSLIFGGIAYRQTFNNPDALIASIGFKRGAFRFGYAYDYTISTLTNASGGAHEVGVSVILSAPERIDYNDCFGLFR